MTLFFFGWLQKFNSQFPPQFLSEGNTNNRHSNGISEIISEAGKKITVILKRTSKHYDELSNIMLPVHSRWHLMALSNPAR